MLKRAVQSTLGAVGLELRRVTPQPPPGPVLSKVYPETTDDDLADMAKVAGYTMATPRSQWTWLKAIDYIDAANIPGEIVECGVWRGGMVMLAKHRRRSRTHPRRYFLYDWFLGMPEPTERDLDISDGSSLVPRWREHLTPEHSGWCYAGIDEVTANFRDIGLGGDDLAFIPGRVEETLRIASNLPRQIAALRLDTDWYDSTKIELETLYPLLSPGGVLILDDYGIWTGQKEAVDEYFADNPILLMPADWGCRMAIKPF